MFATWSTMSTTPIDFYTSTSGSRSDERGAGVRRRRARQPSAAAERTDEFGRPTDARRRQPGPGDGTGSTSSSTTSPPRSIGCAPRASLPQRHRLRPRRQADPAGDPPATSSSCSSPQTKVEYEGSSGGGASSADWAHGIEQPRAGARSRRADRVVRRGRSDRSGLPQLRRRPPRVLRRGGRHRRRGGPGTTGPASPCSASASSPPLWRRRYAARNGRTSGIFRPWRSSPSCRPPSSRSPRPARCDARSDR